MATKGKKNSLFRMTPAERDAEVKQFDRGLSLDELRDGKTGQARFLRKICKAHLTRLYLRSVLIARSDEDAC